MTIEDVFNITKSDLKNVDKIILEFSQGKSELIHEISSHLISSGGKRIRPILLILATKLINENNGDYFNLAAAVELIHSATLLHDDVVDKSEYRRGKKTANAIWDNKLSILVGDYLFSIAFQLMVKSKNIKILELLSKASSVMADGEVMQLQNSSNIAIDEETYLEIIFGKTAILFSAATECGALLNKVGEEKILALRNFGKNLGILFQIIDDILDYSANENDLGKKIGNDFFEGKVTLPIIIAYKKANDIDKKLIQNLIEENIIGEKESQEKLLQIIDLINKYKGLEDSFSLAKKYHEYAIKNISIFEDSFYKKCLLDILNYALNRNK